MPTLKILHNQSSSRPFFALVQNYEDIIFFNKKKSPRPITLWYFTQLFVFDVK